ncbi:hypothetical protein Ddye_008978 [Dipteronia dyeriana]|uniref:Reverse transcriptase n=1 Tax=Dipteronia dyeriana TaxID=168575 RepID=A0AAD9XB45_9ROSI|nr:hypothetical protein Ddye_008978 [Dipteronia dyeriana]
MCFSPNISESLGNKLASIVGVNKVECHETYLGLLCFSGRNKRRLFTSIMDRVWNKIKGWAEKLLSIGGKEVMVKAVIQSIPTYAMGLFRLPKCLTYEIQLLCAHFWWGEMRRIGSFTGVHENAYVSIKGMEVWDFRTLNGLIGRFLRNNVGEFSKILSLWLPEC